MHIKSVISVQVFADTCNLLGRDRADFICKQKKASFCHLLHLSLSQMPVKLVVCSHDIQGGCVSANIMFCGGLEHL